MKQKSKPKKTKEIIVPTRNLEYIKFSFNPKKILIAPATFGA